MARQVFLAVLIVATASTRGRADEANPLDLAKARAAAAQETYEGQVRRHAVDASGPSFESIYVWSRRWLEAEQALATDKAGRLAALQAHLDRMNKWEATKTEQRKQGFVAAYEVPQARFYRLEAEIWLAEAKGK
jgi:hypothetical protein